MQGGRGTCVCVRAHLHIHAHSLTRVYACVHTRAHTRTRVYMCVYVHTPMHAYPHLWIYPMCTCTDLYTQIFFRVLLKRVGVSFSSWNNVFWENTKADGLH